MRSSERHPQVSGASPTTARREVKAKTKGRLDMGTSLPLRSVSACAALLVGFLLANSCSSGKVTADEQCRADEAAGIYAYDKDTECGCNLKDCTLVSLV